MFIWILTAFIFLSQNAHSTNFDFLPSANVCCATHHVRKEDWQRGLVELSVIAEPFCPLVLGPWQFRLKHNWECQETKTGGKKKEKEKKKDPHPISISIRWWHAHYAVRFVYMYHTCLHSLLLWLVSEFSHVRKRNYLLLEDNVYLLKYLYFVCMSKL
jgi:hypothetical protein